jgi:Tfp pilus assembly protein PilO
MTPTEANTRNIEVLILMTQVLLWVLLAVFVFGVPWLYELDQRLDRFEALHPEPVCEKCGK